MIYSIKTRSLIFALEIENVRLNKDRNFFFEKSGLVRCYYIASVCSHVLSMYITHTYPTCVRVYVTFVVGLIHSNKNKKAEKFIRLIWCRI